MMMTKIRSCQTFVLIRLKAPLLLAGFFVAVNRMSTLKVHIVSCDIVIIRMVND